MKSTGALDLQALKLRELSLPSVACFARHFNLQPPAPRNPHVNDLGLQKKSGPLAKVDSAQVGSSNLANGKVSQGYEGSGLHWPTAFIIFNVLPNSRVGL